MANTANMSRPASSQSRMQRGLMILCMLLAGMPALVSCKGGATVTVDTSVPTPLVEPLGVKVGVYYDDQLTQYVHEEDLDYYGEFSIDLGASQIPVFDRVFAAMFESVMLIDAIEGPHPGIDAIVAPKIEQVQFAIPAQTRNDFYEVWIKYTIDVYEPDGALIYSWDVMGYGKANQRNYGAMSPEKEPALNEATTWALRDAAAFVSFHFGSQKPISDWLAKRSI